jgi:protein-S-isoprenylcysteine O-methyltransferase Ste14
MRWALLGIATAIGVVDAVLITRVLVDRTRWAWRTEGARPKLVVTALGVAALVLLCSCGVATLFALAPGGGPLLPVAAAQGVYYECWQARKFASPARRSRVISWWQAARW